MQPGPPVEAGAKHLHGCNWGVRGSTPFHRPVGVPAAFNESSLYRFEAPVAAAAARSWELGFRLAAVTVTWPPFP